MGKKEEMVHWHFPQSSPFLAGRQLRKRLLPIWCSKFIRGARHRDAQPGSSALWGGGQGMCFRIVRRFGKMRCVCVRKPQDLVSRC